MDYAAVARGRPLVFLEVLWEQAWRHKLTLGLQSSLYEKLSFLSNLSRSISAKLGATGIISVVQGTPASGDEEDPESKSLRERVRDKE